jgi:predicted cupin superfamily sugar epimerase
MDPADLVTRLRLEPHPEGGWFRRTFLDPDGHASSILYFLGPDEGSRWHRVDAAEIWTFCAGDPLELSVSADGTSVEVSHLGTAADARPQVVVPTGAWQRADATGTGALVTCVVVPAFRWEAFHLAPEGWEPGAPGWEDPT